MKIDIYTLLGMIKDNNAPNKIKWEDTIYAYSDYDKDYLEYPFSQDEYRGLFCMKDSILTQYLNDEVEIIEEDKKIEKIKVVGCNVEVNEILFGTDTAVATETCIAKINELIDTVNDMKEGK